MKETISTKRFGKVRIDSDVPMLEGTKNEDVSKHADLNRVLDALKVGQSFAVVLDTVEDVRNSMAQASHRGRQTRKTFRCRTLEKDGEVSTVRIWRVRYREAIKRRRKVNRKREVAK